MRILVLQHDDDKGLGLLEAPLRAAGADLDIRTAGRDDAEPDGHAAVVALPGLADPPDDTRAVRETRAASASALAAGLPVLGICLGAELLAEAAGGTTRPCPPEWGFAPVRLLPAAGDDALLGHLPTTFEAFHAHAYAVEPPDGAVGLAETDTCLQAFRVGEHAWGVQFHPEAAVELIDAWLPTVERHLVAAGVDAAATAQRARQVVPGWACHAEGIARAFAEVTAAAAATRR